MKLKAAEKIQEKVSKARMERKRRLKLASKNTSECNGLRYYKHSSKRCQRTC